MLGFKYQNTAAVRPARWVCVPAVGALMLGLAAVPARAQSGNGFEAEFAKIEAALVVLERSVGVSGMTDEGASPSQVAVVEETAPEVATTTTPPPMEMAEPEPRDGFTFLPLLIDQACPGGLNDARSKVDELILQTARVEGVVAQFGERFEALDNRNLEYIKDDKLNVCPTRFMGDLGKLASELAEPKLGLKIQEAEALLVCIQTEWLDVNTRISDLEGSSDPKDIAAREALGNVLIRWAAADTEASRAVSSLVFYEGRRQRLAMAVDRIQSRCAILGGSYK